MNEKTYLLSEKTKRSLDGLIADHVIDLTSPTAGRRPSMPSRGGGASIKWAKITAVTDANNYTASIWTDRNESTAYGTSKALRVWDILDALAINDWIPVQSSNVTGKDYENIQQIGLL